MILESAKNGLVRAARQPALATVLWFWTALLAAVAALPASAILGAAFDFSPEGDRLLDGFSIRLIEEALQYDRSPAGGAVLAVVAGLALVALLGNAFFAGGVLEVLVEKDEERAFLHRFMRGAGCFFARFLRLLVLAGAAALVAGIVVSLAFGSIGSAFADSRSELIQLLSGLLVPIGLLLVAAFSTLVLDYARIRMALDEERSAVRAWWDAVRFLVWQFRGVFVIASLYGLAALVLYGLSLAYQLNAASDTWLLITMLVIVQQATVWTRSLLRVGSYAAALEFVGRTRETPAVPVVSSESGGPGAPDEPAPEPPATETAATETAATGVWGGEEASQDRDARLPIRDATI